MLNSEALQSHIKKLNNRCSKTSAVVVVEGKNDLAALEPILDADFFILNNGKKRSLYETAEVLASNHKNIILMFDADKKGMELQKKFTGYLQAHGISVHSERKLLKLARARAVEDIHATASQPKRRFL